MPATPTLNRLVARHVTGLVVLTLSLLLGLQPIATDLYLPALPALTAGFGAAMSQAQLTLTALLLAFGAVADVLGAAVRPVWPPPHPVDRHGRLRGGVGRQHLLAVD